MGIILMKRSHPEKPREHAAQFVPVNKSDLSYPERQIPIGVRPGAE
jgi:hypothetical protein